MYAMGRVFDLSVIDLGTNTYTDKHVDTLNLVSQLTALTKEELTITDGGLERSTSNSLHSRL